MLELPGLADDIAQIRDPIKALRVADTMFSPEQVHLFARSLVRQIPALHALEVRRGAQKEGHGSSTAA